MSRARERIFDKIVLAGSALAIILVVAGLVWYGIRVGSGPADLEITLVETDRSSGNEVVYKVTIENRGGKTAEDIVIEVTVGEESREVQVPFVTKGDREEVFVTLPGSGQPEARVVSHAEH